VTRLFQVNELLMAFLLPLRPKSIALV
jgi:hypothetical protein